jgi:hypothetical protein
LEEIARYIAEKQIILLGIIPVIRQLDLRFVIDNGMEITAQCIVNQLMIPQDTTSVMNLAQKYVIQIGMDQTVQHFVKNGMLLLDIITVIKQMV